MTITLNVKCKLSLFAAESCHCIAMLRPRSGSAQWLSQETYRFSPKVATTEYVDPFGNLCQRFDMPAGHLAIGVEAIVTTESEISTALNLPLTPPAFLPDSVILFLLPSRYCPVDRMNEQAMSIAGHAQPGSAQVQAVCDWVHQNIIYEYGHSDASTDALDTLNRGAGVCRDFAHVAMALCRSLLIPCRMVVGYLHNLKPMDLHAWFEAYIDGRWYTYDPTQAKPMGGRVVLGYGRDAADIAFLMSYGFVETSEMTISVDAIEDI